MEVGEKQKKNPNRRKNRKENLFQTIIGKFLLTRFHIIHFPFYSMESENKM